MARRFSIVSLPSFSVVVAHWHSLLLELRVTFFLCFCTDVQKSQHFSTCPCTDDYNWKEMAENTEGKNFVWHHLIKNADGNNAKCLKCFKPIKCKGWSTNGLLRHLQSKHNISKPKPSADDCASASDCAIWCVILIDHHTFFWDIFFLL